MSREIKFRSWDNVEKRMVLFTLDEALDLQYKMDSPSLGVRNNPSNRMFDTVMQYTGLKDRNGREIYEGDILIDENANFKPVVMDWSEEEALWGSRHIGFGSAKAFYSTYKVIGNIYENPELLKGDAGK